MHARRIAAALLVACAWAASCVAPGAPPASGGETSERGARSWGALHGAVEYPGGLRLLRVWGTPAHRGFAHGKLLADDIAAIMRQEFAARFASAQPVLEQARAALPRLIEYPDDYVAELDALWQGVLAGSPDLHMPALGRDFDRVDLLVANALDVFGLMGCSGFTVWGDQAVGGGVLTARNFDWPLTGEHMLDHTLLIVQEHDDGRSVASVAWPGYIGTVTGVSADGVAAFLHVGSARFTMPQPSSWPAAVAARKVLESDSAGDDRLAQAQSHIEYTSPPVGFLTHVVLPRVPASGAPAALFEADARRSVLGAAPPGPFVVTNHFRSRQDGAGASGDSLGREKTLQRGVLGCVTVDDERVDLGEAWRILGSVEQGGGRFFGTLQSLVFRHDPWCFEVRVAEFVDDAVVAAPSSGRRYELTRAQVFGER